MSAIYDNWERLVAAVLKKQQLWELFHDHSRTPSLLSEASNFGSSFSLRSPLHDLAFDFARLGSSSRSNRVFRKLVVISDFSRAIDFENLNVDSVHFIGRGTFGTVYAVVLDNGVRILVKRLKATSVSEDEFKHHLDIVGNVSHKNVVALRAYYCSEDERVMMYDHYSTGSVYGLLHGMSGPDAETSSVYALKNGETGRTRAYVSWETRLKIAIGAARGIAEIHTQNGGTLVHGNIKASNIFLNHQEYGCVSDFGVTNMIKTKFMPSAHCYAPEVKHSKNVSQASDVYSFGILLLELLTRKSPVNVPGGPKAVNLVKLMNSVKSQEMVAKVYDPDLLKLSTIREEMIKMLEIGIQCVEKSVKKRPKMSDVVKMLENIKKKNMIRDDPGTRKLVFIKDADATFDLEDMLKASAEVLGKGTAGTSYKVILENGNTIMVKRLMNVFVTVEDIQDHMEIIGRMRHENIAELRAYYCRSDEKMLVYDYYSQDSVSALLHGNKGTGKTPFRWDTRLKIAVGAARGIAHIHKQDGRKLVHGNIKSSNIFLNTQKYGIISDTGLAKVAARISSSGTQTPGYFAPEVNETNNISQASDVYSFGVILLELLSGKSSQVTEDDGKVISLVEYIQSIVRDEWAPQVFDEELMSYVNEETMLRFLQIAMYCVSFVPEQRPRMSEVVKMLEEFSGLEPRNEPCVESRLEGMLEDLLPTLNEDHLSF